MQSPDFFVLSTVFFAVVMVFYAYFRGKIDVSALIASGVVGFLVIYAAGIEWLYAVIAFFLFGNLATRYKYKLKEEQGTAEKVRTFRNVYGNGAAAVLFAVFHQLAGDPVMLAGLAGSMAAACADTFATELGEVFDREPRLITNLKKTRAGTSGAVSVPGLFAALLGAALISLVPSFTGGVLDPGVLFVAGTVAGFLGCIVDSFVGATLEGRIPWVDNHVTNFLGTFSGGLISIFLYPHIFGTIFI